MPYYNCTFLDDEGRYVKKTLFADNKKEVWKNYLGTDEKLLYIKRNLWKEEFSLKLFAKKLGYFDFLLFNQKMITLLRSGVSFVRALEVIINNLKRGNLKEVLIKTQTDIRNGIQISDAFSSKQIPFQKIYRASLLAGERSGSLESTLERFNIYLEKIATLRRKVISSMTYPIILFAFMIGMVLLILVYAIPRFSSFYSSFEAELPVVTTYLVSLGNFLKSNFITIILIVVGIVAAVKIIEKARKDIIIIDFLKIKIPFIGKIIVENAMAVFSRTLAILVAGGIPVPEATQIAVETFSNRYFFSKVKDIPVKIKEGNLLSDVLGEINFIPPVMVEVIKVGESSGNLVVVLNEVSDSFENSIDAKISSLISLIEPILIVVLGLVIAFMLVAVYLPIFSTVKIVK
jgi:type IV pilus assembly protein PilC